MVEPLPVAGAVVGGAALGRVGSAGGAVGAAGGVPAGVGADGGAGAAMSCLRRRREAVVPARSADSGVEGGAGSVAIW